MSWLGLGSKDWVSFNNISQAGFYLKPGQSHVASDDWITKTEAIAKYHISTSPLSPISNNDWIRKEYLQSSTITNSCVMVTVLGTMLGTPNRMSFSVTFDHPPASGTFTITIIGNISGHSGSRTFNYTELSSGSWTGETDPNGSGSFVSGDVFDCTVSMNPTFFDGYYLHSLCVGPSTVYHYTRTEQFYRDNCPGNQTPGSAYTFSKVYRSFISMADAEAQAMADATFATSGQAAANASGSCVIYNLFTNNLITPNGDGVNDVVKIFRPHPAGDIEIDYASFPNMTVKVLNAYTGQIVYQSINKIYVPWNGRYDNTGAIVPLTLYIIHILYGDGTGREFRSYVNIIMD